MPGDDGAAACRPCLMKMDRNRLRGGKSELGRARKREPVAAVPELVVNCAH